MKRLSHFLFVRHRHNWALLVRFGLVGGTGVIVNLLVFGLLLQVAAGAQKVFIDLPGTDFNIRNYHVYSTIAFVVANLSNFQLNRWWTFRSSGHATWWSEYVPFMVVGVIGQALGLMIITLLLHPGSPVSLSTSLFDSASIFSNRELWAQAITIALVTPISFVGNKLWTFRAVRGAA